MASELQPASSPKWMFWTGWVLSALPSALLTFSAVMKFVKPGDFAEQFGKFGFPLHLATPLGIVELSCTIIYLIPQTSVLGAILLTGYMGGAMATHVRMGEAWWGQLLVGIVVWLGIFLRDARLRQLIPLRS
ncbi:MAG: DoxX family protein [Planctomycetes bacterium]|nr:DoxX family protein [Planctomycetota bacterium]